jgi:hypothetical protein
VILAPGSPVQFMHQPPRFSPGIGSTQLAYPRITSSDRIFRASRVHPFEVEHEVLTRPCPSSLQWCCLGPAALRGSRDANAAGDQALAMAE